MHGAQRTHKLGAILGLSGKIEPMGGYLSKSPLDYPREGYRKFQDMFSKAYKYVYIH